MKFEIFILPFVCVLLSIVYCTNGKLLDAKGVGPTNLVTSRHPKASKEDREKFLGDGLFTLGYSTRYNFGGGFGSGYPGHGYGHHGGFRPSGAYGFSHAYGHHGYHGHGYHEPYYQPYYGHYGGSTGGYGFKQHYQHGGYHHGGYHHGGYGNYGYPGIY